GQILVTGEIRQGSDAYRLAMPLALELRNGSHVTQTVDVQNARTPFQVRVHAPPARLTLDPAAALPLALPAATPPNADLLSYEFPLSTARNESVHLASDDLTPDPSPYQGEGSAKAVISPFLLAHQRTRYALHKSRVPFGVREDAWPQATQTGTL